MKNRNFFQIYKAKLNYKETLGAFRKCCQNSHLGSYYNLFTYCLCKENTKKPSIYEMIELLGISLFDKTPIQDLISDTEIELYINNLNYLILKKSTQQ